METDRLATNVPGEVRPSRGDTYDAVWLVRLQLSMLRRGVWDIGRPWTGCVEWR